MWRRYISWVDLSLGSGWPRMNGLAAMIPFAPLALAIVYSLIFHPNAPPSTAEGIIVAVPTIALFGILFWRAYLSAMRQVRASRAEQMDD